MKPPHPQKVRLFLGTQFSGSPEAFSHCIPAQLATPLTLKYIPTEQWHLTWAFLGQSAPAIVTKLSEHLQPFAQTQNILNTAITEALWWPSVSRPMGITLRIQPTPELQSVFLRLQSLLLPFQAQTQLKPAQSFQPHITIARLKGHGRHQLNLKGYPISSIVPQSWAIDHLTLYQSTLTPHGPEYQQLFTVFFSS